MLKNPLDSIENRLQSIEDCLIKLDNSFVLNNNDKWEKGIEVACEVFQVSNIVILQNIDDIPHFKVNHSIYFNRQVLRDYITANSYNVSIMGKQ